MCSQKCSLKWKNYQSNITSVFSKLLEEERFTDVTISTWDGVLFNAHKVILTACSELFQIILSKNPSPHPTIILPQDITAHNFKDLLQFIYKGEIQVEANSLDDFLQLSDKLKIQGLYEFTTVVKEASSTILPEKASPGPKKRKLNGPKSKNCKRSRSPKSEVSFDKIDNEEASSTKDITPKINTSILSKIKPCSVVLQKEKVDKTKKRISSSK